MSNGSNDARMAQLEGNPIWFALPTPDPDGAKAFYSGLFGWEWVDVDMGEGNVYHSHAERRLHRTPVVALFGCRVLLFDA